MIAQTATQTTESDITDGGKRPLLGRTPGTTIPSAATENADRFRDNRGADFLTN